MPKLKDIINEKLERLELIPDRLTGAVEKAQKQVLKEVLTMLDDFYYTNGKLDASVENLAKIEAITKKMQEVLFSGDYLKAVKEFASEFPKQAAITEQYFKAMFGDFSDETIYKAAIQNSQRQAVTLLADAAIDTNFLQPIRQQLAQSITTGASFGDTVKALTESITGTEQEGKLLRYVKTIAGDAFSVADRQYTNLISENVGAVWFHYIGGLIKDSRSFCADRNNKYYHIKEIQEWASLDWAGKNKATNEKTIMAYAGGWNCKHSILPVSEFVVPNEVVQRNIDNGNIKPKKTATTVK